MVGISVRTGTVEVRVTDIPCGLLLGRKRTVTLQRADFVGKTVLEVQRALRREKGWRTIGPPGTLNGVRMQAGADPALRAGDQLVLTDP